MMGGGRLQEKGQRRQAENQQNQILFEDSTMKPNIA